MISVQTKDKCCGCCACEGICPKRCVHMCEDEEGFIYPQVDTKLCINCNLCEKVCPVINSKSDDVETKFKQQGYIVQHRDRIILNESTAGGAFSAIAKYVLDRSGIVFGVELQKDLFSHPSAAKHIWIDNEEELSKFRNSKYIQSYCGGCSFQNVKLFLEQGKYVCFSGTPCQVEGLSRFLEINKTDCSRLILVDVVCRAVPSPMAFRKYIEYQEKENSERIKEVRFRDKFYGYKYSTMNVVSDNNHGNYHRGVESDPWLRAFFSNICDRPSCHTCKFRKLHRLSDFTIWDCFHVGRFSKSLDNDKGATRILIHSEKAKDVFESIKKELITKQVDPNLLIEGAKELKESVAPNNKRTAFFHDATILDGHHLFKKYFPNDIRVIFERFIRLAFFKIGIYGIVKKIVVRVTRKY